MPIMNKITTQQIRSTFNDYFKNNNHTHVPSSSLVPHNDPSLMFVNSGMVQFKNVFTGVEKRDYTRATSSQKSVRAGGKHNDLDNVGYTARHHTFFEMLGNFSFGDYFKEEAIFYAWNLLTGGFKLPKDKLYVTVYHDDDEAVSYWKKIANIGDDRIIRIKTNDNFWSMGDTGPCGPCSEIFYDHGDKIPGGLPGTPDQDGDRYIEIWNLVFMQFEQIDKNTRIPLPKKSVDTGMGLERVSAVIQGVHDNYDTDVFREIIENAESIIKKSAKGDALFSYRVIADHLRSCSFLIADGVMPSNEGRGYVLRRIMRRAMRHAHQLGAKEPLMYKLLPKLIDLFGHTYSELTRAEEFISSVLKQEEERFIATLDRGLKLLDDESSSISKGGVLPGELAFKLYDTYGFPLDLTEDILKQRNIKVDIDGFETQMTMQKERARKNWTGSGESKTDSIWFDILAEHGPTEFLGYSLNSAEGVVLSLLQNGKLIEQISKIGDKFTLITNQTPFYGESGGQMGDVGMIETPHCTIKVIDTLKYLGKIIGHVCIIEEGIISKGDAVKLSIDNSYRKYLRMHHTATHILHAVLRDVLGKHVTQKGSLVAQDKLRFDISHPKALTLAEVKLVEQRVNQIIADNSKVLTALMSTDQAIQAGAMALFGEKYDSEVRVVSLGAEVENATPYSFELCGGTHVKRTGDIGTFKIISESAIAAGVRRIEAMCGSFAYNEISSNEELLNKIIELLKSNKGELIQKIESLAESKKDIEKQLDKLQIECLVDCNNVKNIITLSKGKLLFVEVGNNFDSKNIRIAAENIANNNNDFVVIFTKKAQDRISLVIAVSREFVSVYNAGEIAKKLSVIIGGSGGGQSTMAQAGGSYEISYEALKDHIIKVLNTC